MDIALWWNRMVVVEKTKKEKIVSHQLGVSTGYGCPLIDINVSE